MKKKIIMVLALVMIAGTVTAALLAMKTVSNRISIGTWFQGSSELQVTGGAIEIDGALPGDSGEHTWNVKNTGNVPGYLETEVTETILDITVTGDGEVDIGEEKEVLLTWEVPDLDLKQQGKEIHFDVSFTMTGDEDYGGYKDENPYLVEKRIYDGDEPTEHYVEHEVTHGTELTLNPLGGSYAGKPFSHFEVDGEIYEVDELTLNITKDLEVKVIYQ